jgi:hypothetical protein
MGTTAMHFKALKCRPIHMARMLEKAATAKKPGPAFASSQAISSLHHFPPLLSSASKTGNRCRNRQS